MGSKPAGRELDDAVAREVMEWEMGPEQGLGPTYHNWRARGSREILATTDSFRPSTDIAAAWEVVKKMRADGCFSLDDGGADGTGFVCVLTVGEDEVYRGDGETAQLAIVACALAAARKATGGTNGA